MEKNGVTRQIWYYGIIWVSEVISMTHSSSNNFNGGIPLTNVTVDTVDISKYIDFGFYEKVWFKNNYGLYPSESGR